MGVGDIDLLLALKVGILFNGILSFLTELPSRKDVLDALVLQLID